MLLSKNYILKNKLDCYYAVHMLCTECYGSSDILARFSTLREALIFCSEFKSESSFPCSLEIRELVLEDKGYVHSCTIDGGDYFE